MLGDVQQCVHAALCGLQPGRYGDGVHSVSRSRIAKSPPKYQTQQKSDRYHQSLEQEKIIAL